ncbi:ARMT1-like domain-containing protein [Lutibacter sp. TH_r2]|uniref:damage-control phosphatase ARMT1 family protein n=1 Tax=Lutibacter sp. TH_r2 TaxID=3082083 RepID=UPI0029542B63|nr:ARMT1-like domain-containing protein [Lutibacter sp. TH_r2]MDV7186069.1 ARMT1-like domain-containing protein [Lutibacter sp. TH_r2]
MKTYLDCIPCFMQQALRAGRLATTNEKKIKLILDKTGEMVKNVSMNATPAETGMMIYGIVREVTGVKDPFKAIKKQHLKETKAIYPELEKIVANSDDKLLTAIKIAIAGNIIDLGVSRAFDIVSDVKKILKQEFAVFDYTAFKKQLKKTKNILYIGDNVGESVFDKILINELKKPVKYAVRSIPIINDVTWEDAIASGLHEVTELIDSGCKSPGVILNQSTPEFLELFNTTGLVISKGQGNYEGLSDCNRQVFFLLKSKCPIIANHLGIEDNAIILKEHKI